jgi:hypothetical protein
MNKNSSNNLILVNKIILFTDNVLNENSDIIFFHDYIASANSFIHISLVKLWNEYLKNIEDLEKENFLKSYFFTLKRFQKYLHKVKNSIDSNVKFKIFSIEEIEKMITINQEKISLIRANNYRIKSNDNKEQYINAEEYSFLLEKEDDSLK